MSDPVTTVEIEDVLSSIRRLVSDGDKARLRDGAPPEAAQAAPSDVPPAARAERAEAASTAPQSPESQTPPRRDKLVLTPAYLVSDSDAAKAPSSAAEDTQQDAEADTSAAADATPVDDTSSPVAQEAWAEDHAADADDGADEDWQEEPWQEAAAPAEDAATEGPETSATYDAPLTLTGMVWGGDNDQSTSEAQSQSSSFSQDRAELVATIAELEAAIRPDVNDYEPDGNEPMSDTVAWPGTSARRFSLETEIEDAQPSADEDSTDAADAPTAQVDATAGAEAQPHSEMPVPEDDYEADDAAAEGAGEHLQEHVDEYGDEDLDGLLEAGGALLDEDALRALVAEVVREELTGPLGERITRNVRKLVRREIYRVLSSQDFD